MDVRYSLEQDALRDSVRKVAADLGPKAVGELDDESRTVKLDAAVTDAGWRELRSADDDGTPWASGVEVAVVAEELGRGLADTAFLGPTLAAELRRAAGAAPAEVPETILLTNDLGSVATGTDGALAVDAAGADQALLLAATETGWSLASVPLEDISTPVDLTRPVATPQGTPGPVDGDANIDDAAIDRVIALGLTATAADMVGVMHGSVRLATDYAAERKQYGQPVGAFQAVQHLLADALVFTEGSSTITRYASWAVDALPPAEARDAAAAAKAYASRAARDVGEIVIQVHGGIGNTWECLAHVFLRRSLLSTDVLGGVDATLARVLESRLEARDPKRGA